MLKRNKLLSIKGFILIILLLAGAFCFLFFINHTPRAMVLKSLQKAFSSIDSNTIFDNIDAYASQPFSKETQITLKKVTAPSSYSYLTSLAGTSFLDQRIIDTQNRQESGVFELSYSAIPLLDGAYALDDAQCHISSDTLYDGYISIPLQHIDAALAQSSFSPYCEDFDIPQNISYTPAFFTMSSMRTHLMDLKKSFASNMFTKVSPTASTQAILDEHPTCSLYQVTLSEAFETDLANLATDLTDNSVISNAFTYINQLSMSDVTLSTKASSQKSCYFYIDSHQTLHAIQFPCNIQDNPYTCLLTLSGNTDCFSSFSLSLYPDEDTLANTLFFSLTQDSLTGTGSIDWKSYSQDTVYHMDFSNTNEEELLQSASQLSITLSRSSIDSYATAPDTPMQELGTCLLRFHTNTSANKHLTEFTLLHATLHLTKPDVAFTFSGSISLQDSPTSCVTLTGIEYPLFTMSQEELSVLLESIEKHIDQSKVLQMISPSLK